MKKNWISCLAAAAVLMVSGALYAQDYTLSIAGETTLSGSAGDTVTETYTISMTTSSSAVGAQGYTFGVSGVVLGFSHSFLKAFKSSLKFSFGFPVVSLGGSLGFH